MVEFKDRLRSLMNASGESVYALSKAVAITETTISRLLKGGNLPSQGTLLALAEHFNVGTGWLENGVDEKDSFNYTVKDATSIGDRLKSFLKLKRINTTELMTKMGYSRQVYYNIVGKNANPSAEFIAKIIVEFPDLNAGWLLTGNGEVLVEQNYHQIDDLPDHIKKEALKQIQKRDVTRNFPHTRPEEHAVHLELIKSQESTEFRHLGEERYLVICPLIESGESSTYILRRNDSAYLEYLPKHAIVLPELRLGTFRSFVVEGDGMNDGLRGAFVEGDIVTGRRVRDSQWQNHYLPLQQYQVYVVVTRDSVKVVEVDNIEDGILFCKWSNPDKRGYPDFQIFLADVVEVFFVKAHTERERGR